MKTVFIINPAAGKKKNIDGIVGKIRSLSEKENFDTDIYVTQYPGDAARYVREYCEKNGCGRFIACGGDGTFNEVLDGSMGFDNAEIGVMPMGTGNDFCRNFGCSEFFSDINRLVCAGTVRCDALKYTTELDGEKRVGYCANMFNIGFDCNVADMTSEMKKKPFISGSLAYFLSIFVMLVKKKGCEMKLFLDGRKVYDGKLLLTSIANGCFCGGGIKSNPLACVTDGLININIIKNVSRLRFISLLPKYMNGTVLEVKNVQRFITSEKCRKITVLPKNGKMRLCIDGEIVDAGNTEFEILPGAFSFVVPQETNTYKAEIANGKV